MDEFPSQDALTGAGSGFAGKKGRGTAAIRRLLKGVTY